MMRNIKAGSIPSTFKTFFDYSFCRFFPVLRNEASSPWKLNALCCMSLASPGNPAIFIYFWLTSKTTLCIYFFQSFKI